MRYAVLAATLALAACGETATPNASVDNTTSGEQANDIAADPFGATGAPGADLTDNGVNDGAAGLDADRAQNATE
ncbi:hypothetical protein [Sphingomonas xinjiangensis]|uniref:Uncharacterized protein n=1 Tax=Sphingomonas xinjiangensis TaxID=643568 RepID=A0A840YRR4_9SPHN|nr:hypothetical protein [Sphingomonas xinjiangensis]MBB5712253.1 hypothetical protein [Sphingomonas xinjiangensis]